MPKLRETALYEIIATKKSLAELQTLCYNHIKSGKDLNVQDSETGETYLHCVCDQMERFLDQSGVSIIYIMACKGVDLDIQDSQGETFLHKIVRIPGAYRALVAAVRCGADMLIRDNRGRTARDVLMIEKPDAWEEMVHWWDKFQPGLYRATGEENPDRHLIEKLLKYWCSVNMIKKGKDYSVKIRLRQSGKHTEVLHLLEKYENSIEFALAALSGKDQVLKDWKARIEDQLGAMKSVDVNICDHSYQSKPSLPEVPLPLLAHVWHMNNLEMTQLLLEYGSDPALLYSPFPEKEQVKPLFFQLVCAENKPSDNIIYSSLLRSNLSARDYNGKTLLYEAIKHKASPQMVQFLLKHGINIASRDKYGRTARDYATMLKRQKYVTLIDQYVANLVKDCNISVIESLILQGYDHVLDVVDAQEELGVMNLAKLTGSEHLIQLLEKRGKSREHIEKMQRIAHNGRLAEIRPLMGRKYSLAVDICGRNVCHIAVVNKRRDFIKCFCDNYVPLLNQQDNLGRTPLHYAQLLLEGDNLIDYMIEKGANTLLKDVLGRSPLDYRPTVCEQGTYFRLRKDVMNYALDVYVFQTNLINNLIRAIKEGMLDTVAKLISGLKSQSKDLTYLNRLNFVLFDCIDHNQENIAVYLIKEGMGFDIYKQYECDHSPKSFKDIAKQRNCKTILDHMNRITREKEEEKKGSRTPDCIAFAQFGLV